MVAIEPFVINLGPLMTRHTSLCYFSTYVNIVDTELMLFCYIERMDKSTLIFFLLTCTA